MIFSDSPKYFSFYFAENQMIILFYNELLLEEDIENLRYIKDGEWCLPTVDEIHGCSECEVKYLCGGGCLATTYPLNNKSFKRNRLICPFLYDVAMERLVKVKNKPQIEREV